MTDRTAGRVSDREARRAAKKKVKKVLKKQGVRGRQRRKWQRGMRPALGPTDTELS